MWTHSHSYCNKGHITCFTQELQWKCTLRFLFSKPRAPTNAFLLEKVNREIVRLYGTILILSSVLLNVRFTYDLKKNLSTNLSFRRCVRYICSPFYIPLFEYINIICQKVKNIYSRLLPFFRSKHSPYHPEPKILIKFYVIVTPFHIRGKSLSYQFSS